MSTRPSLPRAPLQLAVDSGSVTCPRHGRATVVAACERCKWCQGTLDGPFLVILCVAVGRAPAIERPHSLIFEEDWPEG